MCPPIEASSKGSLLSRWGKRSRSMCCCLLVGGCQRGEPRKSWIRHSMTVIVVIVVVQVQVQAHGALCSMVMLDGQYQC